MISVRRVYTPKPGQRGLDQLLRELRIVTIDAGFPDLEIYRQIAGPHGTMVTQQVWTSIDEYETSRSLVRRTTAITEIFSKIYPVLSSTHMTELYEKL